MSDGEWTTFGGKRKSRKAKQVAKRKAKQEAERKAKQEEEEREQRRMWEERRDKEEYEEHEQMRSRMYDAIQNLKGDMQHIEQQLLQTPSDEQLKERLQRTKEEIERLTVRFCRGDYKEYEDEEGPHSTPSGVVI